MAPSKNMRTENWVTLKRNGRSAKQKNRTGENRENRDENQLSHSLLFSVSSCFEFFRLCFLCSLLFKIYACKSLYLITLNRKPKSDQASLFLFGLGSARFRLFMGRRKYRAVVRQDAFGLRQPRRGIFAFNFDTDDKLALVKR